MKEKYTGLALAAILAPLAHVLTGAVLMLIATVLEQPTDRGSLYTAFAALSLLFLFSFPFIAVQCDITAIVFSGLAMKKGGSKRKNILILIFAVSGIAASVYFSLRFWQGAMSV